MKIIKAWIVIKPKQKFKLLDLNLCPYKKGAEFYQNFGDKIKKVEIRILD